MGNYAEKDNSGRITIRFKIPIHTNKNEGKLLISKIGASLFLLPFGAMGAFFAVMLVREVITQKAPWFLIFFLIVPLVFMAVGFGGIYAVWFGKEIVKAKAPKAKRAKMGKRAGVLIGLVFVIIGLAGSYWLLVRPLMKTWQAKSWPETPCTIISAEVGSHSDEDGTTYSIDITYGYDFSRRTYRADRYDFIGGSSSGRRGKQAVVDRYKKAANPMCFVNPKKPSEAVLQRELTVKNAIGLFPLIFVVAGAAVMIGVLKHKKRKGMTWLPQSPSDDSEQGKNLYNFFGNTLDATPSPVTLKPNRSPIAKLAGVLVFCLFWNGVVSVFVYQVIEGFRYGDPEWGLTLFMIPFVLIGLGTIGFVIYQILALFNPRYTLILQPGQLTPGTAGVVGWQVGGKASRIQHLSMTLTGQEKATYRVGTDTRTAENTFFEMELVDSRDFSEITTGQIGFAIPSETMHSFEADNNKIIWSIYIHAEIVRWPDVKHSYKIIVSPNLIEQDV
jgi:hypothetical protein